MHIIALIALILLGLWLWEQHPVIVVLLALGVAALVAYVYWQASEREKMLAKMSLEERDSFLRNERLALLTQAYGPINATLICPHCGAAGNVRSQQAIRESTSVTGSIAKIETSHHSEATQRYCDHCKTKWLV